MDLGGKGSRRKAGCPAVAKKMQPVDKFEMNRMLHGQMREAAIAAQGDLAASRAGESPHPQITAAAYAIRGKRHRLRNRMLKASKLMPIRESVTGSGIVIELVSRTSDSNKRTALFFFRPLDIAFFVSVSTPGEMTLSPV
jgi:hypothetical protein